QIASMAVSPDGGVIATGSSWTAPVLLFDAATGKRLRIIEFPEAPVKCLGVSAGGKVVVAAMGQKLETVCVLDGLTGTPLGRWQQEDWPVAQVCFSPDGKPLAYGQKGDVVRWWELLTGKLVRQSKSPYKGGPVKAVISAWPSPDGKLVAWAYSAPAGPAGKDG